MELDVKVVLKGKGPGNALEIRNPKAEAPELRTPRGQKPNGLNRSLLSHQAATGWDAFHLAEVLLIHRMRIVVDDKSGAFGAYRGGCQIIERAASKDKELVVAEGWSHTTFTTNPSR